jgi:hypothetical protein
MNKEENYLYIGSGNSALNIKDKDLSNFTIVCANNAWRLFDKSFFDIWIHSGDFPKYNFPKEKNYKQEISYKDYSQTAQKAAEILNWKCSSPQHYAGYTIFFLGLYWIMIERRPKKIGVLGFDHDYNPEKVKKWEESGKPNIQNKFNDPTVKNMNIWAAEFFKEMKQDSFYGQGTPDPLRLGTKHLFEKFELAKNSAKQLEIKLVNYSMVTTGINTFDKEFLN